MRIISGKYKGKNLLGYNIEGTRPTQDRIKESLFAMIQNDIRDTTILDLFAGSGNLGIEGLSNGASKCYFVDNNHECIDVLKKNLAGIDSDCYDIFHLDFKDALLNFSNKKVTFNIIFLDPPYHLECLDDILDDVIKLELLNDNGIIVCEYEYNYFKEDYQKLKLIKEKKYSYKNIRIYKKVGTKCE